MKALKHEEYGIEPKLIQAIKSLYEKCKSKVKCADADSEWFEIRTGVRTGRNNIPSIVYYIYG